MVDKKDVLVVVDRLSSYLSFSAMGYLFGHQYHPNDAIFVGLGAIVVAASAKIWVRDQYRKTKAKSPDTMKTGNRGDAPSD